MTASSFEIGVYIPFSQNTELLTKEVSFGNVTLKNRLGIAPLEGADGLADGSPSELTLRRYLRYARGGSGMIWIEAIALAPEARCGTKQMMLTKDNLDNFKAFTAAIREAGMQANGFAPYLVIQAHHSGRYSAPGGKAAPHKIQGIGANFIPDALDRSVVDEVLTVRSVDER